tara:strand:+ start:4544 stop:5020 length:477 start_codon:yes stop_codon:yes gene_type:complete
MNKLPTIPKSSNRYCGPAAIAAIAGCTPDEAADKLSGVRNANNRWHGRQVSGKGIKGTYDHELKKALNWLGFRMTSVDHTDGRITPLANEKFKAWAVRTEALRGDRLFLVSSGRHWRVVKGWQSVCGQKRDPHHTNCAVQPGSKVRAVFEIRPIKNAA